MRIVVASDSDRTGKTAIAATGAALALLVAEPTVLGVHDLERILKATLQSGTCCW